MKATKIDGTALAKKHENILRKKLIEIKVSRKPTIVSFCNEEDPPSLMYTEMKRKKALEVGIHFRVENYTVRTSKDEIVEKIQSYNLDNGVDGVMVQLPIPEELAVFQKDLVDLIFPEKDVDGLTENGRKIYMPATVRAVISILDEVASAWTQKEIVVVGSSGEVGQPLVKTLEKRGVKVLGIDRKKGNLNRDLRKALIIISATGQKKLIKPNMLGENVILVDVGLGDFDPGCYEKAKFYTPVIGGVGPMTVISLMENVVESYERRMLK